MIVFSLRSGDKIKEARRFRKVTQKELAERLNMGENGASRIAQYEMNYRTPKQSMLEKIGKELHVVGHNLADTVPTSTFSLFSTLLWLDEMFPTLLRFSNIDAPDDDVNAKTYHEQEETNQLAADQKTLCFDPSTGSASLCGIHFADRDLNSFFTEWALKKRELSEGKITEEEYREWRINWPLNSDKVIGGGAFLVPGMVPERVREE